MTLNRAIGDRIFEAISRAPGGRMDDLVALFPELTWNQVLQEVNQLRLGHRLLMIANGEGSFVVCPAG
jgi:hypothetical protein